MSMRLHASGWRSIYHHEVLAVGLAPEDLPSMLAQRMRWAQGTVQVMLNQVLFVLVAQGAKTWRGQQYSLALFPTWIRACTTAAANVWFGRPLAFAVTPKSPRARRPALPLVWPQALLGVLLLAACVTGAVRWGFGLGQGLGTVVNIVWAIFDVVLLSVLVGAARYQGFEPSVVGDKEEA